MGNERLNGYTSDPNRPLVEQLPRLQTSDVERFQREHVAGNNRVWMIIGDRKQTDFKALQRYGKVVELRKEDIYR